MPSDTYVGIKITQKPDYNRNGAGAPPSIEVRGHLEEQLVEIMVGSATIRLTVPEYDELMVVAQEILKRLDNTKMEALL